MNPPAKGTVTPLASIFSEEEAKKAASYVEEKIGEKRVEMNRLQQFVDENSNLINLVKKLPDQLHHNVMVPFGKMAFIPGRLIHTNEFMVLLGENYYSDKTSKQTVEFLKRRDKTLQSQIHSLKAEIDDFQTEATFFATTASEAAEGLVEIREDYIEEEEDDSVKEPSGIEEKKTAEDEDAEFARIMSKLHELEMEEEQEGEEEDDSPVETVEVEKITEQEATVAVPKKFSTSHSSSIHVPPRYSEPSKSKVIEVLPEKQHIHKDRDDNPLSCIGPKAQYLPKEDQSRGVNPQLKAEAWRDFQARSRENVKTNVVAPQKIESPIQKPESKFDSSKAFTGSIIEHTDNLETNNTHSQTESSGSKPSKPVSRFKAQRR